MKNKNLIISGIVAVIVIVGAVFFYMKTNDDATTANDQAAVSAVVTNFGTKLQLVSILASSSSVAEAMQTNYASYVSPDLLAQWIADPSERAPGRVTSSPWPDHIVITSVTESDPGVYTVDGNVIELTSDEVEHGGIADQYPITATVQKENGNWLITGWINGSVN